MLLSPCKTLSGSKKKKFVQAALEEASKSTMRQAHGCVVVRRGRIIGRGHNSQTFSLGHRFSEHAEVAATKSLNSFAELRGAHIYVVRLQRHTGRAVFSSPCHNCAQFLNKMMEFYGLRCIFYST